ncbi:MAG: glutaredoxin [Caldibacillus debilis]|uniref:Glutaredoxin n=1 Tax=Caldibacillus debilis TaxID=301148 RepID=A0A3E0K825_9BACI|nr:glutaredoxin family protein [Caldibacillus debilis]OUM91321.1 MAG: glutaredoxin [Caldibacillus debilis]REJ13907.1 MAG: glutaredoxin [Caldibacillus debilis]REJ30434.1 MAG: glutaredoxin [Caldibacillus debilis]REJ30773.1 MAG: glutaredoxin [Caldibacillus debilis]
MEVTFYSRPGCHLCERAETVLRELAEELPITVKKINIDDSDEWTEKYGLMIPVLEVDGQIILYGQIVKDEARNRLQQLLSN